MKGLLIKDFMLLKNQKSFLFMIIGFSIMFLFLDYNPTFIISYCSVIGSMFVISSISYDEYENGFSFLMSLPITRRIYVHSKYILGIILGSGFWIMSTSLTCLYSYIKDPSINMFELLMSCSILLGVMLLFLSIMVPVQLKFGQNKGNVALMMVVACMGIGGFLLFQLTQFLNIDLTPIFISINSLGASGFAIVGIGTGIVLMIISNRLSIQIMNKKEF